MPDIEIHGWDHERTLAVSNMKAKIIGVVHDASYADALCFTVGSEFAVDIRGVSTPFLRVYMTEKFQHADDLIARLQQLKIDIEIVMIDKYIPAG